MGVQLQIRWKLLAALLVIGVGPLLLSGWLDARRLSELGARLAEQSGAALGEQTRKNLEQMAENYARRVERERQSIESALRIQVREAKSALRAPASVATVYWSEAFAAADPALSLVTLPQKYLARGQSDAAIPDPVSFTHQAFFAPATASRADLADDAARLSSLTSLYQEINTDHHVAIYRQYVALSNGLIASYPGHGSFPSDYDPRERAWYRQHDGSGGLRWAPPHIDAVSGRAFINVTSPLLDPDGNFIGVAGIDVSLIELLRNLAPPAAIGGDGEALLTYLVEHTDPDRAEIAVAARTSGDIQTGDWRAPTKSARLTLPDRTAATLRQHMRDRQRAFLRADADGNDSVLIYQPFGAQIGDLVFIVPASKLVDPAVAAARYALDSTQRHIDRTLPLAAGIVAAVVLIAFIGSKTITAPINELVDAATRVGEGNFDARVTIRSGDELQVLGEAFNAMVPQLHEHTRVGEALKLAAEVQRRLLPLAPPQIDGLDIAGFSHYSDQTGGDYFDFLKPASPDQRRIGVALGDVSGHGVGSALLMATVRALLHGVADSDHMPAAIMDHINAKIVDGIVAGQFMTLCYIDLDLERACARWCSAGHDPAIRFNCATSTFSELTGTDIPLGIDGTWRYHDSETTDLSPDDVFVIASDGVWETRNARGEFFGKPRLLDLIRAHGRAPAAELCRIVDAELARFRGDAPQKDDVTAVVFRLTAAQPPA